MNTNKEASSNKEIPDLMEKALNDADQESNNDSVCYDNDDDEYPDYSASSNDKNIKAIKQHSEGILNGLGMWVQQQVPRTPPKEDSIDYDSDKEDDVADKIPELAFQYESTTTSTTANNP